MASIDKSNEKHRKTLMMFEQQPQPDEEDKKSMAAA
jgi:hypothetical protein